MSHIINNSRRISHPGLWSDDHATQISARINWHPEQEKLQQMLQTISTLPQASDKWVTIIGTPTQLTSKDFLHQLETAGIARHRIRWIRTRDEDTAVWAAEQAMLLNNSELVIAWLGQCQGRNLQRASLAARVSHASTFIFTAHDSPTPLH